MVAWFIIAIATLAVFAFIAINGVQTVSMTSDAAARVETVRRLDAAAHALVSRAASPDGSGVMYLPAGSVNPGGQGYGLPSSMAFQSQTPFGKRFVYCPFGDQGVTGTTLTIPNADGSNYRVATQGFDGKTYIVGTDRTNLQGSVKLALAAKPNIMGFVMAPRSKLSETPSCRDVVYNSSTGKFEAPDAVIRPLTRESGVDETRTIDARRLTFFVSQNGTGTGSSATDPASFATALNYYKTRIPAFMTINMAAGNYVMGAADLEIPYQTNNFQSVLAINGAPSATFVDMATAGSLQIPGHLVITGVTFDQDVTVAVPAGTKLTMNDASVGSVIAYGDVSLGGANTITRSQAGYAFRVENGGRAFVGGTLQFFTPAGNGVYVNANASFSSRSAALSFNTANSSPYKVGIAVVRGGSLSVYGGSLQFPVGTSYGIYSSGGDSSLYSATLAFGGAQSTYGIIALEGSNIDLSNSVVGSGVAPRYGVYDQGAFTVAGNASSIFASVKCWEGNQFTQSDHGAGKTSKVLDDVAPTALPAAPTSAQIQAYSDQQAANALRQAKRQSNRSEWTCNA